MWGTQNELGEAAKKEVPKDNKRGSKWKTEMEDGPGEMARKKWQKRECGRQKRKKKRRKGTKPQKNQREAKWVSKTK